MKMEFTELEMRNSNGIISLRILIQKSAIGYRYNSTTDTHGAI